MSKHSKMKLVVRPSHAPRKWMIWDENVNRICYFSTDSDGNWEITNKREDSISGRCYYNSKDEAQAVIRLVKKHL